jgi:dihydrodipicolinate synthase/N-acetylneuraminate lyase
MIVPPFDDALSWRELLAHYTAVAAAIEDPIMYSNLPSASGVTSPPPSSASWEQAGVPCLKDADGDAVVTTELIQTAGPKLLNGRDTLTLAALAAGVRAVVWAGHVTPRGGRPLACPPSGVASGNRAKR